MQAFAPVLAGSDVDPYAQLGATKLFVIQSTGSGFRLAVAPTPESAAVLTATSTTYPATDAGIAAMYEALSESDMFAAVGFVWVPGGGAQRFEPTTAARVSTAGPDGYDPDSGLRAVNYGSAVAQAVPVSTFFGGGNVQSYDPTPQLVPLALSLVYAVSEHKKLGDMTYPLPAVYTTDLVEDGNTYANYFSGVTTASNAMTGAPPQIGALTYTGTSPTSDFGLQTISGFYRDAAWTTSLGTPIYDFGTADAALVASAGKLTAPTLVFNPASSPLSGGTLPVVLSTLQRATTLTSNERLLSYVNQETNTDSGTKAGLVVTTAELEFDLSSPAAGSLAVKLVVPVAAAITVTPEAPPPQPQTTALAAPTATTALTGLPLDRLSRSLVTEIPIGAAGNLPPTPNPAAPATANVALDAFIPREALTGTGIIGVPGGTTLPVQNPGTATDVAAAGNSWLNLTAVSGRSPTPWQLNIAALGVPLTSGTDYVVAVTDQVATVRAVDGATAQNATLDASAPAGRRFVGVFTAGAASDTSVTLYPLASLALPAPTAGSGAIRQGTSYEVRLGYAPSGATYDVFDTSGNLVAPGLDGSAAKAADGSRARSGDLYFGSFVGGDAQLTLWSVPIFAQFDASALPPGSGTVTVAGRIDDAPTWQLHVTDTSLFIHSGIDPDTGSFSATGADGAYLASAVINSAPDDQTSAAFAPTALLLGAVRSVPAAGASKFAFVPQDDSIVIAGVRYLASVIDIEKPTVDPTTRPYPAAYWPDAQYWQFANRHNPYLDVRYEGETQDDRIAQAKSDIDDIRQRLTNQQEPMHLYLDIDRTTTAMWPIYAFPFTQRSRTVDPARLGSLLSAITGLLGTASTIGPSVAMTAGAEVEDTSATLSLANPFVGSAPRADGSAPSVPPTPTPATTTAPTGAVTGSLVTDLASGVVTAPALSLQSPLANSQSLPAQQAAATLADTKRLVPPIAFEAVVSAGTQVTSTGSTGAPAAGPAEGSIVIQPVYGFSVLNSQTGEAYLVEVVDADLNVPDELPNPTTNMNYDPYYVRVVFLATRVAYNMSILVPTIAYDQHRYFAEVHTEYANVVSETDELTLGYLHSDRAADEGLAILEFAVLDAAALRKGLALTPDASRLVYSNLPYAVVTTDGAPITSEMLSIRGSPPTPYFLCRRLNWDVDCHLMRATHNLGSTAFLAFGGGDLAPLLLDKNPVLNRSVPGHFGMFTESYANRDFAAVQAVTVNATPLAVTVTTQSGTAEYLSLFIDPSNLGQNPSDPLEGTLPTTGTPLTFPTECYVVGQATTTLTRFPGTTGQFASYDENGNLTSQFALVPYGQLVYLVRAVQNVPSLAALGGLGITSGLLIDTFVPASDGFLTLAQGARFKRSGLAFYGNSYTPTTLVDSLDNLDFTSITGETFYAPTIFIPIPELDTSSGFVADLSDFLGATFWTVVYPELVVEPTASAGGAIFPDGLNIDDDGKPVLSLQKLQFVYDSIAVAFTPNDLTHAYPLQAKQQILALTNGQLAEGLAWRTAHVQPDRTPPHNITAQSLLEDVSLGPDAPNIVYSPRNRPIHTPAFVDYRGMSVQSIRSVSATVYNIEESAFTQDQTASGLVSQVSSNTNMLLGVLFDYDGNEYGTLAAYDPGDSTKGLVLLNGYLGPTGYVFSSADHFDVDDVLQSQTPLLEHIIGTFGPSWDLRFYNPDIRLPEQFWTFTYDGFTAPGVPNFVTDVPTPRADPTFANRTRSLLLNFQNRLHPDELGLLDTYSSVVSANLHLANGVTGSVLVSKKADRNVASISGSPTGGTSHPLVGLEPPAKYDFFLFSRDHYETLADVQFHLIDQGYAMCLVDDGTGTGSKTARYYVDTDGNYYELYSYVLFSASRGILETSSFPLRIALGAPANPNTSPATPETPNNVNPQDLVKQINTVSNLIFAAAGPSAPGQPPQFIPIQVAGGADSEVQAGAIVGPPGFNGYQINVVGTNRQPVQIANLYVGGTAYPIAGTTTVVPFNVSKQKPVPFYGSLSYGLDKQVSQPALYSDDLATQIPRPTVPQTITSGLFGGAGVGALIGTSLSFAFQGSAAIPPQTTGGTAQGAVMRGDDSIFYTVNAPLIGTTGSPVTDSTGKSAGISGHQYFIDETDPQNPIWGIVTLPSFSFNQNSYSVSLSTTALDGVTPRYTLVVGGDSYLFGPDAALFSFDFDSNNTTVAVDNTRFTFNPVTGGAFTVTHAAAEAPATSEAPNPITLNPFTIVVGGSSKQIDVFNDPAALDDIVLGPTGRLYSYDPVAGAVTITVGASSTTAQLQTGLGFASASNYAYILGINAGDYTVNGQQCFGYNASTTGTPASYPLLTSPQVFTIGGDFYVFDQDATGAYTSVTGAGQIHPVNPYQFSINGTVYVIDQTLQPNVVIGGGRSHPMTSGNTQFELDGAQYTIALKGGSLLGATVSGQFNIEQGNVVVIEDFVYQLDTLNAQVIGNGASYPLTTSGSTYTISTTDDSFTVTSAPNATTVTLGNVEYLIGSDTVVGDGVVYPILPYRSFADGTAEFEIGLDGHVTTPATFPLSGTAPYTAATFTDGATYTVNVPAAFDGTSYYPLSGTPQQFVADSHTYTLRSDAVAITAGASKTYLGPRTGPLSPNAFALGPLTIHLGRYTDIAAFDGTHYYAVTNHAFTDTTSGLTYTVDGNTAVNEGNSYEIFSNLGQSPYFEVPGGPTYFINIPVADTGSASGDIFTVFPVAAGGFTIPLTYTIAILGGAATVSASTFAGPTAAPQLGVAGTSLTGGYFTDPVTGITYTVVVNGLLVTLVDSNNAIYAYTDTGAGGSFTASVVVSTGVQLAVDETGAVFPVANSRFTTGAVAYTVGTSVAYETAAGPYWPIAHGRFTVPRTSGESDLVYMLAGQGAVRGYAVSADDQFSVDGTTVYTVNAVNVVKTTSTPSLTTAGATQTLTDGADVYTLDAVAKTASIPYPGLSYDSGAHQLAVSYRGIAITYTLTGTAVTDNRTPQNSFTASIAGSTATFTDSVTHVSFSFDTGGGPSTVTFAYTNDFFLDALSGTTYYIDQADSKVNALSYLPETTRYGFVAGDGVTYLIHYNDVSVVFPVVAGEHVNAGVTTVGADEFTVHVDEVVPLGRGAAVPTSSNSFEINGEEYSIAGTPAGADYSSCQVVGGGAAPRPFTGPATFVLSDPTVTYTLHLDGSGQPDTITADFAVRPSQDLIVVADDVYVISYATATTGTLLGQGSSGVPIVDSKFTLTNRLDSTKGQFTFADLDIFDAASVVGQFTVYSAPSFVIGSMRYTLDTSALVVTDASKHPYPLVTNPAFFSISGANYLIDTNQVPHAVVGNGNVSPLATDVTIQSGQERPNSTFTLGGLVYRYVEDALGTLLTIAGTTTYPIAHPALTFKLDSSLVFTLSTTPPVAGNYPGTVAPIGTVTAGATVLNVYAGIPESGGADFFTYKNQLYTLIKSTGTYEAVQKSYTVYLADPAGDQQQLAVFDIGGTAYLVTDGTTTGDAAPKGTNPGTLWAATATTAVETQFGLVYGFAPTPTTVTETIVPSGATLFQFLNSAAGVTTLYDVDYTAGALGNHVQVDVPSTLPSFDQPRPFDFVEAAPLTVETGGYNAFTTFVDEYGIPAADYAASYERPFYSTDPNLSQLMTVQGDFSVELWHSVPAEVTGPVHPVVYTNGTFPTADDQIFHVDIDYEDPTDLWVRLNNTAMQADGASVPLFGAGWRHLALTYTQPYTMSCTGDGFQVKNGSSYDLAQDFSIAFTFSASDVTSAQGIVYKGAPPVGQGDYHRYTPMSYRVTVHDGTIGVDFTDATGNVLSVTGTESVLAADTWYEVVISKMTSTPLSQSASGPYTNPFPASDLASTNTQGVQVETSGEIGSTLTVSNIAPQSPALRSLLNNLAASDKSYTVSIAVRPANDDGSFGPWQLLNPSSSSTTNPEPVGVSTDQQLQLLRTGASPLLLGMASDGIGQPLPLGSVDTDGVTVLSSGKIRDVYLFNTGIYQGSDQLTGLFDSAHPAFSTSGATGLMQWGIVGYWKAAYDPNGVVANTINTDDVAVSRRLSLANLTPTPPGREYEGTALYINGYQVALTRVPLGTAPASISGAVAGSPLLRFEAGAYRLQEISVWQSARQQFQVLDDMFGRLVPSNEPYLALYLGSSFTVPSTSAPALPVFSFIDNVEVVNLAQGPALIFSPASLDLTGSPALSRIGPLVTPNLYTAPGDALTLADTPPALATFSVTVNSVTGTLAGIVKEAYLYISGGVLMLYIGKKVGDLALSWVSQEQGDPQLIGYIEGAPPAPMANLTNKPSYAGATSVTLRAPTSVTYRYAAANTSSQNTVLKLAGDLMPPAAGLSELSKLTDSDGNVHTVIAPFGAGAHLPAVKFKFGFKSDDNNFTNTSEDEIDLSDSATERLDELNQFTVRLQGAVAPYDGDQFMASLNSQTVPSATPGVSARKAAIVPDPTVGGFTASNPPAGLPKTPVTDEKYGQRMFLPSPYGHAFVTSTTLDIYQQTLLQTNTVFGFVGVPNSQIPRDLNIIPFRMSSKYLRPGVLDGVVGYGYKPITLANGTRSYGTSTGEMELLADGNFDEGEVGHNASYMRIVEAYTLKRQIDQQAFSALALYASRYASEQNNPSFWDTLGDVFGISSSTNRPAPRDTPQTLVPNLDFYDEYVWSARGGTQEVRHTYTTTYEEVQTTSHTSSQSFVTTFNFKLTLWSFGVLDMGIGLTFGSKSSDKYTLTTTGTRSFDIQASFDGIENDTQMRYASNNDAHFVMRNNSMFNRSNDSGLELVIGSDGLVYNIESSVSSGAGLPLSDNVDSSRDYGQPQPAYSTGNADGTTGALVPYDRPGKTSLFRSYAFFLQPNQDNASEFWNTVVDPVWFKNSLEPSAVALREALAYAAHTNPPIPWRLLYRVTYSERFPSPTSDDVGQIPQITPLMAVPVLDAAADFLYHDPASVTAAPAHNPSNDVEANPVLVAPTTSGALAGSIQPSGPLQGQPLPPNNVIPFDLLKSIALPVSWGDTANSKLLSSLVTSALGLGSVPMTHSMLPGSTLQTTVTGSAGEPLYSVYIDPNGLTVNVPVKPAITVLQDVNGNPVQYFDGKIYRSLQGGYLPSPDGTIMYYLQPPSSYDQTTFDVLGDYDLFGHPGDEWRYYLVSGYSADLTADAAVGASRPFVSSAGVSPDSAYAGFSIANSQHPQGGGPKQVGGYVIVKGVLQWPNVAIKAETLADVSSYKALSVLDTFPVGDPSVLIRFVKAQYPQAPFIGNQEIIDVFARNVISYFNTVQQGLIPQ